MDFKEDPRIKTARKILLIASSFFALYIITLLLCSYLLGHEPLLFGLPLWIAVGNLIVPVVFVVLLILVAEKMIPDISLTDEEEEKEKNK